MHDRNFLGIEGIKWLPWVGENYPERPIGQRLLVVGESHYFTGATPEARLMDRAAYDDPRSTRTVVENLGWGTKTWKNLPRLLFRATDYNSSGFWKDAAFYNFVQRPLDKHTDERPTDADIQLGWAVFIELVQILRPSHCLFIGVGAFKAFNHLLPSAGVEFTPVTCLEKIGTTYGRKSTITINSHTTVLIGIRHLGRYFSWRKWNDYLAKHHPDMTRFLHAGGYNRTSLN